MLGLATANGIEIVFHLSGELIVDKRSEMLFEQAGDRKCRPSGNQRVPLLKDILAGLNRLDNRGIGTRATNTFVFQLARQGSFRKTAGRLGRVVVRLQVATSHRFTFRNGR